MRIEALRKWEWEWPSPEKKFEFASQNVDFQCILGVICTVQLHIFQVKSSAFSLENDAKAADEVLLKRKQIHALTKLKNVTVKLWKETDNFCIIWQLFYALDYVQKYFRTVGDVNTRSANNNNNNNNNWGTIDQSYSYMPLTFCVGKRCKLLYALKVKTTLKLALILRHKSTNWTAVELCVTDRSQRSVYTAAHACTVHTRTWGHCGHAATCNPGVWHNAIYSMHLFILLRVR